MKQIAPPPNHHAQPHHVGVLVRFPTLSARRRALIRRTAMLRLTLSPTDFLFPRPLCLFLPGVGSSIASHNAHDDDNC